MRQDLKERFQLMALRELPRLRRFALHLCGDVHRADDYVQGTLEKMYVAWPRVHDISYPGAYLRAVMLRHVLNERRRPWRRERSSAVLPERGYDTTQGADLGLDLTRALSGLTTRQRAAVVLRYVEDRPVAEVAQIMGTTPGTVKRQCSDGVTRLRHILGEDFVEDGLAEDDLRRPTSPPTPPGSTSLPGSSTLVRRSSAAADHSTPDSTSPSNSGCPTGLVNAATLPGQRGVIGTSSVSAIVPELDLDETGRGAR